MHSRWAIYGVLILLFLQQGKGAFEDHPAGARGISLGGHPCAVVGDLWAGFRNPSLIAGITSPTIGISIVPGAYGLVELSRTSFGYAQPVGPGAIGGYGSRFGFDLYQEIEAGLTTSLAVTPRIAVGLAIRLYALSVSGYGKASCVGITAGFLLSLSEDSHIALQIDNLNSPRLGPAREPIPASLLIGVSVHPLEILRFTASVGKEPGFPVEAESGIEFSALGGVRMRAGVALDPVAWSGGLGIVTEGIEVDYGVRWHLDLGVTHAFTLTLIFGGL